MIELQILDMIKAAVPAYCRSNAGRPSVKDGHIHLNDEKIKIPLERPVVFFELNSGFDNPTGYGHNERLRSIDEENYQFVYEKRAELVKVYQLYCWIPLHGKYGGQLTKLRLFESLQQLFAFEDAFTLKFSQEDDLPPDEGAIQAVFELTYKGKITKERREDGFTAVDLSFSFE